MDEQRMEKAVEVLERPFDRARPGAYARLQGQERTKIYRVAGAGLKHYGHCLQGQGCSRMERVGTQTVR